MKGAAIGLVVVRKDIVEEHNKINDQCMSQCINVSMCDQCLDALTSGNIGPKCQSIKQI